MKGWQVHQVPTEYYEGQGVEPGWWQRPQGRPMLIEQERGPDSGKHRPQEAKCAEALTAKHRGGNSP